MALLNSGAAIGASFKMKTIAPYPESNEDDPEAFKPLTAEQARQLREQNPSVSPWWVVAGQVGGGLVVALATWGITGRQEAGWSAAYGALAVILPAALFARGLTGRFASLNPGTAVLGFFLWEMVKIALSVAMMIAAPRLLTMKVYWVAMAFAPKRTKHVAKQTDE